MIADTHEQDTRRYRGVSTVRPIDAAKDKVPIIDLADLLCGPGGLRRIGVEWAGRCPLPGHEDKTPSFTVNPEKNLFFCHGCLHGGSVVDLARLAWGYAESEVALAAAQLLHEFGHEIPQRPASWHSRQSRQEGARRALEQAAIRRAQRRIYRWIFAPIIATFEDEDERLEEAAHAWADAETVARNIVNYARGEGGVV